MIILQAKNQIPSTESFIDIQDIKDDVLILKNGTIKIVIAVSAINFALKSSQEQEAIIYNFQEFLNSLDFPIQIVITSRRFDIENYLNEVGALAETQVNDLLKNQVLEYVDFVKNLVEIADIMDKKFYITVPFAIGEAAQTAKETLKTLFKKKEIIKALGSEELKRYKDQLLQRVNHVIGGLSGIGLDLEILKTEELVKLLYSFYNPV